MRITLDGSQVRRLRRRLQLTQKELGQALGWCQPYISYLECGHRVHVQPETLARLAEGLGVEIDALLKQHPGKGTPGV